MLPHARSGGVAGLLELLIDRNGRDDIYRLADDLAFEIDDLLPIVEASSLLGFITVKEGDAEVTEEGARFAEAGILRRKELFKVAAMRVPLIRQIVRSLESKSDHSLPEEFFRDMLEEHFSEQETDRQLETALNWGRYAELFDRDASSGRFYISVEGHHHE
jgi:NitT/TauT family transport system ATP-binding protein